MKQTYMTTIYKALETNEGETYRPDLNKPLKVVIFKAYKNDVSDFVMNLTFKTEDQFNCECTSITEER